MSEPSLKRLFDVIYYQQEKYPQPDALGAKINGQWETTSTESVIEQTNLVSQGLLQLGIQPGDKIAMISNNRPEWVIMDLAALQIGAIDVPIYPTISPDDYRYIFNDAEVKLCFVSDGELLEKVNEIRDEVPSLQAVYSFDTLEGVQHWTEVRELGRSGDPAAVTALMDKVQEDDLATLIYTSGTTGVPKGVML
ncbi:MAG: AMP-binding protein, partial [Bacteroidota bacterium]